MKTLIACLVLISASGCATLLPQPEVCWAKAGATNESYRTDREECRSRTRDANYRQLEACLESKGYREQYCSS